MEVSQSMIVQYGIFQILNSRCYWSLVVSVSALAYRTYYQNIDATRVQLHPSGVIFIPSTNVEVVCLLSREIFFYADLWMCDEVLPH